MYVKAWPGFSSMSAMRATGMKACTPLSPCGSVGPEKRGWALPIMLTAPYPTPKPPPGRPICPSIAARVTSIQNGCSPWSERCSDQAILSMVRAAAISRASAAMRAAGRPVMPAAHCAVLGCPSCSPRK
ncbi:hypothetical protein D3C81_1217880 [compost metagenome]